MLDLCVSLQFGCLTSYCWKVPWIRSCKSGKWDPGEFDNHALLHHPAVLDILLIHPFPIHLLLLIIILLLLLPIPLFQEVWKASRPSLLSCRYLQDMHWDVCIQAWPPSPLGSKTLTSLKLYTSYKIATGIRRLWFSDVCHPEKVWRTSKETIKDL